MMVVMKDLVPYVTRDYDDCVATNPNFSFLTSTRNDVGNNKKNINDPGSNVNI